MEIDKTKILDFPDNISHESYHEILYACYLICLKEFYDWLQTVPIPNTETELGKVPLSVFGKWLESNSKFINHTHRSINDEKKSDI